MSPALPSGPIARLAARLRDRASRGAALTYGATLLIAAAVIAAGVVVADMRQEALDAALANTSDIATLVAEQTTRSVQAVDRVMRDVQDFATFPDLATPADFKQVLGSVSVHDRLASRAARLPQVDSLALIAADGVQVNNSITWPAPPADPSDRDYLRHFAAENDPGLFVSQPVVSQANGNWTVFVARRVNGRTGNFLGVVQASMPIEALTGSYSSISLPEKQTFMLLRRDGVVLAQHPDATPHIGQMMPLGSRWYQLVRDDAGGSYVAPGYLDATMRLVAVRPLRSYPLVVDVGLQIDAALSHWRRMSLLIGVGITAGAGALALLAFMLRRQFRRLEQSRSVLRQRNRELTTAAGTLRNSETALHARSDQLATMLAAMDQGLMMVDPHGIVAVCNVRAIELLNLNAAQLAARPRFVDLAALHEGDGVLDLMRETLLLPSAPLTLPASLPSRTAAQPQSLRALPALPPVPQCSEHHLSNGRILEVRCVTPPAGGVVATFDDVTARRSAERQIAFMARHDVLTRLPNRIAFVERLEQAIAQASRGKLAAVLCMDLDHFKDVNDTLGHLTGDCLLRAVADRLGACVRQVDMVARFGGDEFAVVQVDAERVEDVALLARRIIEVLSLPYELDGHQVVVGASLGIALIPNDGADPDTLLKHADIALYRAKSEGRGGFRSFAPAMDARLQERRQLELDLQHAMLNQEFELFYQPLIDLGLDRVCGFEALLRWHHPRRGLLEPREFVPLSEEMGLIVPLGSWALREACREAAAWPEQIRVAVNLSPVQFRYRDLVQTVADALHETGLPGHRLDLEITEAVLLQNSEEVMATLHGLRALGVRISMDDFGTGYSSLSYLRSFPFDKIKIDQSFVRDLADSKDAAAIVQAVARLGNSLGMVTTAEGVETSDQLAQLRAEGCTEVQGYLFSPPRPATEVPHLLCLFGHRQAAVA